MRRSSTLAFSVAACAGVAMQSLPALAVVGVDVLAGRGSRIESADEGKTETKLDADVAAVSLNLSPIPVVPVSFGVEMGYKAFASESDAEKVNVKAWNVSPQLMAWIPGFSLSPFAKVSRAVYSKAEVTSEHSNEVLSAGAKDSATQIGGGLRWSPVPLLSVIAEYRQNAGKGDSKAVLGGVGVGL